MFVTYGICIKTPGLKKLSRNFKSAGLMLSEYFIVSPEDISPIKQSCKENGFSRPSDN